MIHGKFEGIRALNGKEVINDGINREDVQKEEEKTGTFFPLIREYQEA